MPGCRPTAVGKARADRAPAMAPGLSLYLDVLRFTSAFAVLLSHLFFAELKGQWIGRTLDIGIEGVIAFFVLSGFVISYAASRNEPRLTDFAVNRLGRLYSVAVPTLLIVACIDIVGMTIDVEAYKGFYGSYSLGAVLASLTFTNDIWWAHVVPFSDPPYWSLAFEFWYYAIFAAFFYARSRAWIVCGVLLMALVGPRILLLFPTWLLGCLAYRIAAGGKCGRALGTALWLGSLLLAGAYYVADVRSMLNGVTLGHLGAHRYLALHDARHVLNYYAFGILVALNIVGFAAIAESGAARLARWSRPIRALAGMTFCLYLLHLPLLQFFSAVFRGVAAPFHTGIILVCTLASVALAVPFTERKKHLWRDGFRRLLGLVQDAGRAPREPPLRA